MTSVKGIYENGRVTLAEPIPANGPLEVVVVYEEKDVDPATKPGLFFPTYDASLSNASEQFGRDILY